MNYIFVKDIRIPMVETNYESNSFDENLIEQIKRLNSETEQAIKEWEKRIENLGIPEKHIRLTLLEVDKLALKYGWVTDWGHTTPAETDDLLREWSDAKTSEEQEQMISNYFIEYYTRGNFGKFDEFLATWYENPIFKKRMLIFQDSLFAIKSGGQSFNPSNLVVPVLISQTDGIIGELLEREDL